MQVLITAGGTIEYIDPVRYIANGSTGALGAKIAEKFLEANANITYIHGKNALLPKNSAHICFIPIESFEDAKNAIIDQLKSKDFDVIIHSMAVSDYSVEKSEKKISSEGGELILKLIKNQKIISFMKEIQPNAILFGFKLLSDVSDTELIKAARILLFKNSCDYVLANDLKYIKDGEHRAFLIDKEKVVKSLSSKEEIADIIYTICVLAR